MRLRRHRVRNRCGFAEEGDGLLRLAEAEFVRRSCTNVSLQLGRGNDGARGFYRRHGYTERAGFELLDKMLPDRRRN